MAIIHIHDTAKIKVSGRLSKGKAPTGKGEFRFWKDDVAEAPIKVTLGTTPSPEGSPVTHEYQPKPVPADKSSYKLKYGLYVEGDELVGELHHYVVWPKKGALQIKLEGTGAAVDTFKGQVKQAAHGFNKEKTIEVVGGGNKGKYELNLQTGSDFTVTATSPWTIVEGGDKTGSVRELTVKEALVAEFHNPSGKDSAGKWLEIYDKPAQDEAAKAKPVLKHYVNLPTSNNGWDALGNIVTIEMGAQGDKAKAVDKRIGAPGKFLFFHITFSGVGGAKSARSFPKTEPLGDKLNLAAADITEVAAGVEYKGKVELASPAKTGKFQIELGYAGGDTCLIKIGGTAECKDAEMTIVNWRKLEYEIIYPDLMTNLDRVKEAVPGDDGVDIPKKLKKYVKERLGAVYIEYTVAKSQKYLKTALADGDKYCLVDSKYLGQAGPSKPRIYLDYFLRDRFNAGALPVSFESPQPTHRMRIYLAHAAYSAKTDATGTAPIKEDVSFVTESHTHTVDGMVLVRKNPKLGTETLDIAGCKWMFAYKDVSGDWSVAQDVTDMEPPVELAPDKSAQLGSVADRFFRVTDVTSGKSHEIHFKKEGNNPQPTDLTAQEKLALKNWVLNEFEAAADKNIFKTEGNKLRLEISGDTTSHAMLASVKTAVKAAFAADMKVCNKVGRDWSGNVLEGELKKEWFVFEQAEKLVINLPRVHPNDPGSLAKKGQGIFVEFKFDECYGINGLASQDHQILVIPGEEKDAIPEATAGGRSGTVCHELGHRMGMTIMAGSSRIPKGMPEAKTVDGAGEYYRNGPAPYVNGIRSIHVGSHCAHGIPDGDKSDSALGDKSGDCIMFGSGDPTVDSRKAFCPTCAGYVKARKLTSIICSWGGLTEENS